MISFDRVSFTYPATDRPTLRNVTLVVEEGELCLLVGATGSGKSTLLRAVNGLVPRFSGGTLAGTVTVAGRDTAHHALRDLADLIGFVAQDPVTGFVTETVEDELAYTMEQLGLAGQVMRQRVEETLDLLGLSDLRGRRLSDLSGGEAQRVAIGSVLTAHPSVLVLDEPTSALDPPAAEEVLSAITRLVHDLGMTVVMAEHRLERVVQYADTLVQLDATGTATAGPVSPMMEQSPLAPPVVELARLAGWTPAPLSIRDARRRAAGLRARLDGRQHHPARPSPADPVLVAADISVVYGDVVAVREVNLTLTAGTVTALMGRNGAGKTSLLWALQGSVKRWGGSVSMGGDDPADLSAGRARAAVGLVPQTPADLLYLETVEEECRRADLETGAEPGSCAALLKRLVGAIDVTAHPSDLSEGQRLALVLAIQLTAGPRVVLLDEPTRGLDYSAKRRLGAVLADLAASGRAVMVSTHDVEFVAEVSQRVVVMADGEVVADGPTAEVVVASPAFAPQVAKILAPQRWLTVAEVSAALEAV